MSNQIPPVKLPPSPSPSWRQELAMPIFQKDKEVVWPADLVKNAASGSSTTQPSPTPASEVSPTQFAILIDALREQTAAILKLVRSNEALILAMSEEVDQEPDPDAPQTHYLSGRKI